MKTTRRNLLKVAAGGASAAIGLTLRPETSGIGTAIAAAQGHSHAAISGPMASATMTFGSWQTDPPLDRFTVPTPPFPNTRNHHPITPNEVTIQAGGTVNFIIGGFHLLLVYDHGTKPEDINKTTLIAGMIDDPVKRIYRGLDPRTVSQDRVEAVNFSKPGTYLVACGVLSHFLGNMIGYVRVLP
jgi:hypothetical protein